MNERLSYHPHRSARWTLREKKNMLLNKREAAKTVKTGFDIWKGRFYHKKPFIGPNTREGLIKRRQHCSSAMSAMTCRTHDKHMRCFHPNALCFAYQATQLLPCVNMALNSGRQWCCSVLITAPRAALGRRPQLTLPVILMSRRTSSPPSNTSASFTAVPAGEPLCSFKRKKETDLIIGRRNDPASIWAS